MCFPFLFSEYETSFNSDGLTWPGRKRPREEKRFRVKFSLQVLQCPLEDVSVSSDCAFSLQLLKRLMDSIKACWKQKEVLNKAYIRIRASGDPWACGDYVKDNPNGRRKRVHIFTFA